jgi:predicted nucleotidyltransferase
LFSTGNLLENRAKLGYFDAMRSHDVIDRLKKAEPALRSTGVDALYLFGSHARDDASAGSDVDVFVDPKVDEAFGFLQFMKAYDTIVDAIGPNVEVGYSTREGLSRYIRDSVEREARRIF